MACGRCLIVTALDLGGLATSRHGIYQRFQSLVEAASLAGMAVEIAAPSRDDGDLGARAAFVQKVQTDVRRLWGLEITVTALPLRPQPRLPWSLLELLGALRFRWTLPVYRATSPAAIRALRGALSTDTCLVIAHRLITTIQLAPLGDRTPVILDLDDIEHAKAARLPADGPSFSRRLLHWLGLRSLKSAERTACARATRTLVCSELDADYLRSAFRGTFVSVPNAVSIPSAAPGASGSTVMLMVGIYSYQPNAEAAQYFIREVFPLIRQQVPDAEVWFAGKGEHVIAPECLAVPGVKFLGFQPSLEPLYAEARLAICPIRGGGGTRIKIIEAAAYAVPCVSTTVGAEGLQLSDGKTVLIGDTAAAFAKHCIELLRNHALAAEIGTAARSTAIATYSRDAQVSKLAALFQHVSR